MGKWYFIAVLMLMLAPLYSWGFRALPRERWQIICAVPVTKLPDGSWQGLNLTYYGLFFATALSLAAALVVVLIGASDVHFGLFCVFAIILIGVCFPSARLIARWVEKKQYTFSVGAASFVGITAGPWLVLLIELVSRHFKIGPFDAMSATAAAMIGYALGEGMGRLACISFGCCYGKPMEEMPQVVRRYFGWAAFTFAGGTKKIAYAHQMEGQRIFAVQAVTAVLYTFVALAGTLLYLSGHLAWAFILCLTFTQGWRFVSEFFRSDYRGDRRISVYQIMSLLTIPYAMLSLPFFPVSVQYPQIAAGLRLLWNPATILALQMLWAIVFFNIGRSEVTGSALSFHVHHHRI